MKTLAMNRLTLRTGRVASRLTMLPVLVAALALAGCETMSGRSSTAGGIRSAGVAEVVDQSPQAAQANIASLSRSYYPQSQQCRAL